MHKNRFMIDADYAAEGRALRGFALMRFVGAHR